MLFKSVVDLVGNTPLVEASNFKNECGSLANIYAKVESFNPAGSAKDRVALKMIEDAEANGTLKKGATIIEPTSGNTGIGIAAIATVKGYNVIIVMPDTMSVERQKLMTAYGAKLVLTPGALGMKGSIDKAEELNKEIEDSIIAGQFYNPSNPMAHYLTTGPEIYNDLNGNVDIFIAGIGTGGTLSGVGKYLKEKNPNVKIIGVEPASSPLITKGYAGAHAIQGIGANFIPDNLDKNIYDEVIAIENEDSFVMGRLFVKSEGILIGISSGAALKAAEIVGKREENKGKNIVVLLPDTGARYLSTSLFE